MDRKVISVRGTFHRHEDSSSTLAGIERSQLVATPCTSAWSWPLPPNRLWCKNCKHPHLAQGMHSLNFVCHWQSFSKHPQTKEWALCLEVRDLSAISGRGVSHLLFLRPSASLLLPFDTQLVSFFHEKCLLFLWDSQLVCFICEMQLVRSRKLYTQLQVYSTFFTGDWGQQLKEYRFHSLLQWYRWHHHLCPIKSRARVHVPLTRKYQLTL